MLTFNLDMPPRTRSTAVSNGRQEHPKGPLVTVDEAWKDDVRVAMKARGWDQKDLAEKISVSPASISNMFKPGPRQIRFKARIHELFEWPDSNRVDELRRRIEHAIAKLSVEDVENMARIAESLASKR